MKVKYSGKKLVSNSQKIIKKINMKKIVFIIGFLGSVIMGNAKPNAELGIDETCTNHALTSYDDMVFSNEHSYKEIRLAITNNVAFFEKNGGSVTSVSNRFDAILVEVNKVFMRDVGVKFVLVGNNDDLIKQPGDTDFVAVNSLYDKEYRYEVQNFINSVIGVDNYDVGVILYQRLGGSPAGIAKLGGATIDAVKGLTSIAGLDTASLNFAGAVAHELGHTLNAQHTFACYNDGATIGVEMGPGCSIMGYPGRGSSICGSNEGDFCSSYNEDTMFFHGSSIDQIKGYVESISSELTTIQLTTDYPPLSSYSKSGSKSWNIPVSTPFAFCLLYTSPSPRDA